MLYENVVEMNEAVHLLFEDILQHIISPNSIADSIWNFVMNIDVVAWM